MSNMILETARCRTLLTIVLAVAIAMSPQCVYAETAAECLATYNKNVETCRTSAQAISNGLHDAFTAARGDVIANQNEEIIACNGDIGCISSVNIQYALLLLALDAAYDLARDANRAAHYACLVASAVQYFLCLPSGS